MKIACLHTMQSNVALFDAVCPEGVTLEHHVREDLLKRALENGSLTEEIEAETAAALKAMGGDAQLLTCSTVGPAAARAGAIRVDAALAREAAEKGRGKRVEVLATAPTTMKPTRDLFEEIAGDAPASLTVTLIEGAIDLVSAGDFDGYYKMIAEAADASDADVVALAQASMAPAAALAKREVLTSPSAGLAEAAATAKR